MCSKYMDTTRKAINPPKSERGLAPVVIPRTSSPIKEMSQEELHSTPFWTNWEEHIHDPQRDIATVL